MWLGKNADPELFDSHIFRTQSVINITLEIPFIDGVINMWTLSISIRDLARVIQHANSRRDGDGFFAE